MTEEKTAVGGLIQEGKLGEEVDQAGADLHSAPVITGFSIPFILIFCIIQPSEYNLYLLVQQRIFYEENEEDESN